MRGIDNAILTKGVPMKIRDAAGEILNETKIDTAYPASSLFLSHDSFLSPCRENPASPDEYRIVKRGTVLV